MTTSTTIRSPGAIALGCFFAGVTGYVLFKDVLDGAALSTQLSRDRRAARPTRANTRRRMGCLHRGTRQECGEKRAAIRLLRVVKNRAF
jgi:hypothetical protein